ncbi:MAG TPA: cupin domain-containing protein [Spirochaetia bacterium]|nr:cupin domain-containing protein [Spirochaetia bacterium]
MIKTHAEMEREVRQKMRGGQGSVEIVHIFRPQELKGKVRLMAHLRLEKGSSIGFHVHEGEEEVFYILRGAGMVSEGAEPRRVTAGDAVLTGGGAGHAIENPGDEPLEFMATILTY